MIRKFTGFIVTDPTYKLILELNEEILGEEESGELIKQLTHILPHLVTRTDECSLFIISQVINGKQQWHLTIRPTSNNSPAVDSSKRDLYTTKLEGDAHLRAPYINQLYHHSRW